MIPDTNALSAAQVLGDCFQEVVAALRSRCVRHYGERLVTVGVFGSVGRATPGPYSDVDTLIIANPLPRGRGARLRDFAPVEAELSEVLAAVARRGCHTTISPIIKTPAEVAAGSLLFLDMIEDLRLLYDRDRFFRNQLDGFAARLRRLGARRIRRDGTWHWDLKPDYRPGEVFEL